MAQRASLKVLALASYPSRMAATRFRVCEYVPHLARRGIHVDVVTWLDDRAAGALYSPGEFCLKGAAAGAGFVRLTRAALGRYDLVWVQREPMLIGPPLIEAMTMLRGRPMVLDYDDAIWIPRGGRFRRAAKCAWKTDWALRRSAHALAGSSTLAAHAKTLGAPVTILRTVVDHDTWRPLPCRERGEFADPDRPVIGWVGTHSTATQLEIVAPALRRLREEGREFDVAVVGAGPRFTLDRLALDLREWTLEAEVSEFQRADIGLAPSHESEWHDGKCAFKQVQYMAVGVPCVTSWVGGARDFVRHGENALVARSESDWYAHLSALLDDREMRAKLSSAARSLVETEMCTAAQVDSLANVLRTSARGSRAE